MPGWCRVAPAGITGGTGGFTAPLPLLEPSVTVDPSGNTTLTFQLYGLLDRPVTLQTSTDLLSWATLTTVGIGQSIDFRATNTASEPKRFYRSVFLP